MALERLPDGRLRIQWSDDVARDYTIEQLREACPCAACRGERGARSNSPSADENLQKEPTPLTLSGMTPVGNYAYSVAFSDGHATGIYTFDLLRELGKCQNDSD